VLTAFEHAAASFDPAALHRWKLLQTAANLLGLSESSRAWTLQLRLKFLRLTVCYHAPCLCLRLSDAIYVSRAKTAHDLSAGGEERLLATANSLLGATRIGTQPIVSFAELQLVATDLFVALFEVMFFAELAEIRRQPETFADSVHNANTVLDILGQVLGSTMDLPECVTGAALAAGDKPAVAYLLRVFAELGRVTTQHQRQQRE